VLDDKAHNDLRNRKVINKVKESINQRTFDELVLHNEKGN